MSFIYIASPYSHPDPAVRHQRYLQTSYYVVKLFLDRKFPYSPIVSNHHLALEFDLKSDAHTWMAYNFAMLGAASELHVLQLDGWAESSGVLAEINFWRAARQGLPIYYVDAQALQARTRRRPKLIRGNQECQDQQPQTSRLSALGRAQKDG